MIMLYFAHTTVCRAKFETPPTPVFLYYIMDTGTRRLMGVRDQARMKAKSVQRRRHATRRIITDYSVDGARLGCCCCCCCW